MTYEEHQRLIKGMNERIEKTIFPNNNPSSAFLKAMTPDSYDEARKQYLLENQIGLKTIRKRFMGCPVMLINQ